jgi:hypothetical protein
VRISPCSDPNALRNATIWAARLLSSTVRFGQTRAFSASLLTTAPGTSISAISTSKARPPSLIGLPSAIRSRRSGNTRKRPNTKPAGRLGGGFIAEAYKEFSQDFTLFHHEPAVGIPSSLFVSFHMVSKDSSDATT